MSPSLTPSSVPTPAPAQPFLQLERVTYSYAASSSHTAAPAGASLAPAPAALRDLTLTVAAGEYVAIVGHNGSGKSTLARLLNGLLLPQEGVVRVAGHDTRDAAAREEIRARVGMIFSDPDNQIIATVVEDDIAWSLAARGYPRHVIAEQVQVALSAVGLLEARGRSPHQLSGGQRQRLAIAGVLALEPACIVADEPTAQLDPRARAEVVALLAQLHRERGLTLIYVTHQLEEAALAERIVVLDAGRIALQGAPARMFADLDRLHALRLVVPEVARLGERLRALGVPIPPDTVAPEALVAAVEVSTAPGRQARA
jgi:energy-coupling factor transport system ATP-binding protein